MPNISNLLSLDGQVYVYLPDEAAANAFLRLAQAEGFRFADGAKPTQREPGNLYALHENKTIAFPGFAGHAAFQAAQNVNGKPLIRVDGRRFLNGERAYLMEKPT